MTFHSELTAVDGWCQSAYERSMLTHRNAFWIMRDVLEGHARWYTPEKLFTVVEWAKANLKKTEQLTAVLKAVESCIKEVHNDKWSSLTNAIN